MKDSEDDLLVYLAGSVGADPAKADEFRSMVLEGSASPSKEFLLAIDEMLGLAREAERRKGRSYRERLVDLARDRRVVSGADPQFPLNAAKFAILTALDFR
ncbi:MAG: hypothetical protein M5U28_21100 [Sandaracinaceae bacterium]|nr:hypothetical protein [Sandaracinaceae bacterium]